MKNTCIAPRELIRLMIELGELTLGIIVSKAGLVLRLVCGRYRVTLELGAQPAPAPALPVGA
jgi:hypothetical protein